MDIVADSYEKSNEKHYKDQFIVGIGASIGGKEAILELFDNVPENTGYSFFVIEHISADYKSIAVELLSQHTKMEVVEAENLIQVVPDTVYLITDNKYFTVKNNHLYLEEEALTNSKNKVIDNFLISLAQDKAEKAIAVILSGPETDGSQGIQAIKKAGGVVFVQDPKTACFDEMPESAIATGSADFILSPESIAEELLTFHRHKPSIRTITDSLSSQDEAVLSEILNLLKEKTLCDFVHYKRPTIIRRLTRRMGMKGCGNILSYLEVLRTNSEEMSVLCQEFLIGITQFFRNEEAFEELKKKVIPEIFSKKTSEGDVKIWVAGCSTGEEAYSIGILVKEYLEETKEDVAVKIFATDISKEVIEFASRGVYSETKLKDVSEERLQKYFVKEGNAYKICPEVRKYLIFSIHNTVKDIPYSKTDLISCRNMLIYLTPVLQNRCLSIFHFALKTGGYLFLGSSESLGELSEAFSEVSKKWRIFKNTHASKGLSFELSGSFDRYLPDAKSVRTNSQNVFSEVLLDTLLMETGSAGFYVDYNFQLLESFGNYKKFVDLPEEKFEPNLLKMLPHELALLLGSNLRKVVKDSSKIELKSLRVKNKGNIQSINIFIKPCIYNKKINQHVLLLIFQEIYEEKVSASDLLPVNTGSGNNEHFIALEQELTETKEILQRAIEDSEGVNEELQSSNEELISSNEELQTAIEELQSLNEELHTINNEYQLKIKEITELHDDLDNFLKSSDIAQIFLDTNLITRKFTPATTLLINLIEGDIGRSITHISTNFKYSGFIDDIHTVMDKAEPLRKEIEIDQGKWYEMKIFPYLREGKHVNGTVVTFTDITNLKTLTTQLEQKVRERTRELLESEKYYRAISDTTPVMLWITDNNHKCTFLNKTWVDFTGQALEEGLGFGWLEMVHPDDKERSGKIFTEAAEKRIPFALDYRIKRKDGEYLWAIDSGAPLIGEDGIFKGYAGYVIEIAERKKAEEELRTARDESEKRERLYETVTNNTPDLIYVLDLNYKFTFANDALLSMWGLKWEQAIAKGFLELGYEPWQAERHIRELDEVVATKKTIRSTVSFPHATLGKRIYDYIFSPVINPHGEVEAIVGTTRDITELKLAEETIKKSEARKAAILESSLDAIITIDVEGNVIEWNTGAERIFGYSKNEVIGKEMAQLIIPERYRERHLKGISHYLATGEGPFLNKLIELPALRADGREFIAELNITRTPIEGSPLFTGTLRDITERKKTEENLKTQNEQLTMTNNDLDNFIYTASHDLKAPVSNIEGLVNSLKDILDSEKHSISESETGIIIQMIEASISRFKNTIADLTEISKAQRGDAEDINEVNCDQIIKDVKLSIYNEIVGSGAIIKVDLSECNLLKFSRKNFKSIIYNLLSNAIKYRDKSRTPEIFIKTEKTGGFIVLSVTDNGLGIDKPSQAKIFGMFKRAHDHVEGTGIGLYIVKRIIENVGGKIEVESERGKGSTFKIYFPTV